MTLESQVVSLPLAQRLKELGVKQDSLFMWGERFKHRYDPEKKRNELEWKVYAISAALPFLTGDVSAFTVAELGEMLPCGLYFFREGGGMWNTLPLEDSEMDKKMPAEFGYGDRQEKTEADARAKMLVYLIENKLIEV